MTKRLIHLDIARIVACFLVVVNHTAKASAIYMLTPGVQWLLAVVYYELCKVAVPLYVMISGALLLRKIDAPGKLLTRIVRIAFDLVIFSAGYYAMEHWGAWDTGGFLGALATNNVCYAYWYLYMYLCLLILMPLLQRGAAKLSNRALLGICAGGIFAFGLVPQVLACAELASFDGWAGNLLWVNFVFVALLGFWAENRLTITTRTCHAAACGLALMVAIETLIIYATCVAHGGTHYMQIDQGPFASYLISALCAFIIIKFACEKRMARQPFSQRATTTLSELSACTFGVYLIHVFFILAWEACVKAWCKTALYPLGIVIAFELVVFVCAFVVSWVLRKIPGVKRVL